MAPARFVRSFSWGSALYRVDEYGMVWTMNPQTGYVRSEGRAMVKARLADLRRRIMVGRRHRANGWTTCMTRHLGAS